MKRLFNKKKGNYDFKPLKDKPESKKTSDFELQEKSNVKDYFYSSFVKRLFGKKKLDYDLNNSSSEDGYGNKKSIYKPINLESEARKAEALQRIRYAAREFGKTRVVGAITDVPREQQVSIDLDSRIFFDHEKNQLLKINNIAKNYYHEIGRKDKISYFTEDGRSVKVRLFSPKETENHIRVIKRNENGEYRLFNKDGSIYDTGDKISKGNVGEVAYALTLDDKLVTHEHLGGFSEYKGDYAYYHSSLINAKPGKCFGMMVVKNGQIIKIDSNSGHYKPAAENLYNAIKVLYNVIAADAEVTSKSFFLDKDNLNIEECEHKESKKEFIARMEKRGKDNLTMPERYFSCLRKENDRYGNLIKSTSKSAKIVSERMRGGHDKSR